MHLSGKRIISIVLLSTLTLQSVSADQTCPLSNSTLTDLRSSSAKLVKTITLSADCKSYQDTVNQANDSLKQIADQFIALDSNDGAPDLSKTALQAVNNLDTISSIFKDKRCGKELFGFMDYAETFIDVANGMIPFLAIYGGVAAMPWVLGPAFGGAAAKALISFFQNKSINMRDPDQSNVFIKNSCSFYNLNLIKNSIDQLKLRQFTSLEKSLEYERVKLKRLEESKPKESSSMIAKRLMKAKSDHGRLLFLKKLFSSSSFEACSYIKAFALNKEENEDLSLPRRIWHNYSASYEGDPLILELEEDYLFKNLTSEIAVWDPKNCQDIGTLWLEKFIDLSSKGISYLEAQALKVPEVVVLQDWLNEKEKIQSNVSILEAKLTFFQEMVSQGFNTEYSELIRSHKLIQDAIFENQSSVVFLKTKGLAEAWLKVKQEDAQREYTNFFTRRTIILEQLKKIQKILGSSKTLSVEDIKTFSSNFDKENKSEHQEVNETLILNLCGDLRHTWNSWYNGLIHAQAGNDFCQTFRTVINEIDYPSVHKICFGKSKKKGKGKSSLQTQVKKFNAIKNKADDIAYVLDQISCHSTVNDLNLLKESLIK